MAKKIKGTQNITIIIQTYNEEKNIEECIQSAKLLSEDIIVVDTESKDKTIEIVKRLNIPLYSFPYNGIVEYARSFGVEKANGPWVFFLDADEEMTKKCAASIKKELDKTNKTHFGVYRKNVFAKKKWLKYGGWWPDNVIRLIDKKYFVKWPTEIHSAPIVKGEMGEITAPFIHNFHISLENMVEKTIVFEDKTAGLLYVAKKTVGIPTLFRKFLGELYRRLIKWQGYKDGHFGIIESIYQAYSKTITYIFLYEKHQKSSNN